MSQPQIWGNGKPREESLRTRLPPFPFSCFTQYSCVLYIMASESPHFDKTPPRTGLGDQYVTPTADSAKRKAEQTSGTQTRTKRNRYISIAWYDKACSHPRRYVAPLHVRFAASCKWYSLQSHATFRSLWKDGYMHPV